MPLAGEYVRAGDVGGDVGCRLRRVAAQSITSGNQIGISWDTEDADTDLFITVTSTTITIPTGLGGLYAVTAEGLWAAAPATGRNLIIVNPGTSGLTGIPAEFRNSHAATETQISQAITIPMLEGDTFTIDVFQTSGGPINITGWMSCYRIAGF